MPCVNRGLNRTSVLAHDGTVGENTAVSSLKIQSLAGPDARELVDELAQIRIRVFREWPYLYAGSLSYERGYLTTYFDCAEALVLVARDNDKIVGASTALPLRWELWGSPQSTEQLRYRNPTQVTTSTVVQGVKDGNGNLS